MGANISMQINGQPRTLSADPDRTLLEALREDLGLTGTHFGCGAGDCGACSVHIGGTRRFSCQTLVSECQDKEITTIEGLAKGDELHPVQKAFMEAGAYQCGYCTSGMIMAASAMFAGNPSPSDEEMRQAMNGNLCRCCGYERIMDALRMVASGSVR